MRIVYDKEHIHQLLDNFSKVSSVSVSLFDTSFNHFTASSRNYGSYCRYMRQNAAFCEACDRSNRTAMEHVKKPETRTSINVMQDLQKSLYPSWQIPRYCFIS